MKSRRKPHQKSRTGCVECKRRRIKCSEEKPQCANCLRYSTACVYPSPRDLPAPRRPSSPSSSASQSQQTTPQAILFDTAPSLTPGLSSSTPQGTSFDLKDLALLHHWTLKTSRSILNTPKFDYVWQTLFPEIAFRHAHVMHSILSVSALHAAYLNPDNYDKHLRDAAHHHVQALGGFREGINSIGPHNSDALFTSATLAFFYAFLTFGKPYKVISEDASTTAYTSRILGAEWIPLTRGLQTLLHPVYDHLRSGPLLPLLDLGNWEELDPDDRPGPDDANLLQLKEIWANDERAEVYNKTLYLLRRTNVWMAQFHGAQPHQESQWGYNRDWSGPFIWLFASPEEYFVLQGQRQPAALVLLAYFGALLQQLNGYWWMEGCGKSIVGVVDECLGPYWSAYMVYPKQVVGLS